MARKRRPPLAAEIRQTRPFASLAQETTLALLRTADVVRRRLARLVEPEGITLQQYNVLRILRGARGTPLSANEIGERLIEETPGVSRLIDRLVGKGLVWRDRAASDRRRLECFITERGLDLLARLDEPVNRADAEVMRGLGGTRLARLNDLLAEVRARNA